MAELSMNETTTFRWSFDEDVTNYAAAEIRAMGAWRQKISDFGQQKAVELLDDSGMKVSHVLWAGGFTGSDGRSYRESVEDAREALHAAAELKAESLVVYSGARAGHTFNHARRLFQGALKELVPVAEKLGVNMAVEPMHPGCATDWTFLTSVDDALELLASVDSPVVKMVLDTYHLGQDEDFAERIGEITPHLALVQLGDALGPPTGEQNRCRLGDGVVPLSEIVAALKSSGYDGYYDVELLGEEVETFDYQSLLEHAKDAFAKLLGE